MHVCSAGTYQCMPIHTYVLQVDEHLLPNNREASAEANPCASHAVRTNRLCSRFKQTCALKKNQETHYAVHLP